MGGGYHEYVIFKMQIGTILLFVLSVLIFFGLSSLMFGAVLLLFLLNFYSIFKQLKGIRHHYAYKYFFGGLNVLGLVMGASNFFIHGFNIIFALSFLSVFALFLLVFHLRFRKNFVFGKVLVSNGEWAAVRVQYDICSGVRNGFYAVRSKKGLKKGDEVKIELTHRLGERKMPWKVIG